MKKKRAFLPLRSGGWEKGRKEDTETPRVINYKTTKMIEHTVGLRHSVILYFHRKDYYEINCSASLVNSII